MRSRRLGWAVAGAAAVSGWILAARLPGGTGLLPCPIRHLIGVPCPGCGMTRALLALARGDWGLVQRLHPLAPLFVAELCLLWLWWGAAEWGWVRGPRRREVDGLLVSNALLLALVWVWRLAHGSLPA